MLSFGGVCVVMQTCSVTGGLGIRTYLTGKLIQTFCSYVLAETVSIFLFPSALGDILLPFLPVILLLAASVFVIFRKNKEKRGRNSEMIPV